MKKIALFICMACVALGMSAQTITSTSLITLKSAGVADKEVGLLLSADFSNDWDNTWDATPAQAGGIYVFYQGAKYSMWASNEYSQNLALAFDANDNTEYTLHFTSFLGEEYTITDLDNNNAVITVNASTQDYVFTIDESEKNSSILDRFVINYVPAPAYAAEVTTNAYGLATFSFDQPLAPVEAGVKLYKGAISGNDLNLTQVADYAAEQGVVVYGEANTTYHFEVINGATADFSGNKLLAASAWQYPHAGTAYVLSGSSLYIYEGENMKPNKAFLLLQANSGNAPRRISFRFNGATAFENVEMNEAKAVKFMEDGKVFIKRGDAIYNLQGQLVK
jgi:hypothetical protein